MKKKNFILLTTIFASCLVALTFYSCKKQEDRSTGTPEHSSASQRYHCPMHPTYTSDKPGDCPICGMRLVPITEDQQKSATQAPSHQDHRNGQPGEMLSGLSSNDRATVSLSQERQQLIGVRTASVSRRSLEILVRASGRVAYDPDLYNAIVEHVEALKAKERVKESPLPEVHEQADSLIRSSALRLRQMGLSQTQIEEMSQKTENPTNLLLSERGESVWIYAQIYEYESGLVKSGQMMEVTSSANPGRALKGKVVAVDTILNPETRTLRVRGEVPNPEGLLRPEMYVDATIHVNLGEKLSVAKEAVLDSGHRKVLFVEEGNGNYAPRDVRIGREAENYYEVISGVKEGEKIVVSANFLLDSESKLKAAVSGTKHKH